MSSSPPVSDRGVERAALLRRGVRLEYAALGWWWADPAAGYVLVFYAAREVHTIVTDQHIEQR